MFRSTMTRSRLFAATLSAALAAAASAAPNLVVRIDGQVIATNYEHDFGEVLVGESLQLVVVLRNESSETLQFTENPPIMIGGGFPEHFELIQPALETGNVLSPNGSTAFAVRFEPEFEYANLFTHVYIWTDASATPFHIIVRGRGVEPAPAEDPNDAVTADPDDSDDTVAPDPNETVVDDPNYPADNNTPDDVNDNDYANDDTDNMGNDDGYTDQYGDSADQDDSAIDAADETGNQDDASETDEMVDLTDEILPMPGGLCGFGAAFGLSMSMAGMGAARIGRRRSRKGATN